MNKRRALVCSYHTPQTDRDSGARRIFNLIEFLQQSGWDVNFIASDGVGDIRDVRALQQRAVAVYDGMYDDVEEIFASRRYDLAIFAFWLNAERYLPIIRKVSPSTPVIVDSIDLHFLREVRGVFHQRVGRAGFKLLGDGHGSRFIRELNTYAAADGVLTVSQKEADLINDLIGDPGLSFSVPDYEDLLLSPVPFAERKGILSVGSFQHKPNVEAVEYLCKEILPLVDPALLEDHPVYIVGNCLDKTVRSYGRHIPQVRMVGWVPSVEPYFERARISVVPLLYGAGTKRKMIQALMAGTPTVATSIGAEGLRLRDGEHFLLADDAATFAASITRLLKDEELWHRLLREGHEHIAKARGKGVAQGRFAQAVDAVLTRKTKPAMLGASSDVQQQYRELIPQIRDVVCDTVPPEATILVVSKGDEELLRLNGHRALHFPQADNGGYAGHYPADSAEAIAHLEALRAKGGDYLLFPNTSLWWLDHYREFKEHLDKNYQKSVWRDDTCVIYGLRESDTGSKGQPYLTSPAQLVTSGDEPLVPFNYSGDTKLIAFYLPQFHPIPENDAWWGEGFTEWRNAAKANPSFPGHYQPHLPADLGFYDLRLPETRQEQANLARSYGIHGFCYYHYWFSGKQLLERPFNEVLKSGEPDFPFSLCWANDPWSRRWDGRTQDLLQAQIYSEQDDLEHIRWLLPALADPRAIMIEGKPLFLVYRGKDLPDAQRTTDIWREEVARAGMKGIYLIAVETAWDLGWDATTVGFDAKVLFQPQFGKLITSVPKIPIPGKDELQVYDYNEAWRVLGNLDPVAYRRYETVCPGWDNTARVGDRAVVLHNSTPAAYEEQLRKTIQKVQLEPPDHRIVFINAWNEWAEGCHLEPDRRFGHAYLEATRRALTISTNIPFLNHSQERAMSY
jgi:glycosyltransferase involved in cell wall biosynthesis